MERPWWRRLDGLPPGIERRRSQPLSSAMVQASRIAILAVVVLVVVSAAIDYWREALQLVTTMALVWVVQPKQHRRQILGRHGSQ